MKKDKFSGLDNSDMTTFKLGNFTQCNHCGKIFQGNDQEINAIMHLFFNHLGAKN